MTDLSDASFQIAQEQISASCQNKVSKSTRKLSTLTYSIKYLHSQQKAKCQRRLNGSALPAIKDSPVGLRCETMSRLTMVSVHSLAQSVEKPSPERTTARGTSKLRSANDRLDFPPASWCTLSSSLQSSNANGRHIDALRSDMQLWSSYGRNCFLATIRNSTYL